MSQKAIISILSQDRIGLISDVTGHLFDVGVNLGDSSFAILGSGGKFSSLIEVPLSISLAELAEDLSRLPSLEGADINVKLYVADDEAETAPNEITHRIRCEGADQPGLLARLSEVFLNHDANIVRLKSDQKEAGGVTIFTTRMAVFIPENRAKSCLAALGNTAEGLGQFLDSEKTR